MCETENLRSTQMKVMTFALQIFRGNLAGALLLVLNGRNLEVVGQD